MAIVITTVVAVSGFLYWHNDQQHRQNFIRNNLVLVKLVAEFTTLPLVFDDKKGAEEQLSKLLLDQRIAYVRLKNANGEIMADYDPDDIAASAPALDAPEEWIWLDDRLYFSILISYNNQNLGLLTGAFKLGEYKRLKYAEQIFIIAAVMAAVAFSFIMALVLRRFVMSSIQQLESHARRIAEKPDLDEFIAYPSRSNDEISQLYEAFNLLMKQVRSREAEILQLNADLESKIKQRTEDLTAALKIKSAFLANMSHEIRTPMNAILGMHQLALETELTQKQHNYLTKANTAAKWLLGIINDVLDFSKLEAGKIRLEQISFGLESVIQYLEDVAKPLLNGKQVTLEFSIGPGVPKALIGDQLRISQILLNLISNAIKFTDSGTITLHVDSLNAGSEQATLRFSVIDTGVGISEEQQQNLFKAFTQADSSTTRKYGGTGLGLAICKDLVTAMGGKIAVKSRLGAGSCFSFTLELGISKKPLPISDATGKVFSGNSQILKGMRLLLVEDNLVNQELMLEVLSNHGLKVDIASNGAEAITQIENNHYDAVLMDCQMPVMDGFIATRTLRSNPRFSHLPIIAMTANVLAEDRARCLACGMNDHIGKPIDWEVLFQRLVYWLSKKSSAEQDNNSTPEKALTAYAFPTLAGVDQAMAQKIVSGNVALYRKLLLLVRSKHLNDMATIRSAYAAGEHGVAALQAHTLSGTLSTIGAMQLAGAMKALQDEIKNEGGNAIVLPRLAQAEIDFDILMNEIDRIIQQSDKPGAILPVSKFSPRILLVEDCAANQEIATEILEKSGYQVVLAVNGQQALNVLNTQSFAAILMDIHMPVLDGFDTTRQIRQLAGGQDMPIIALTAAATEQQACEALAAGMNAHIAKPIDPEQLLTTLNKLIKNQPIGSIVSTQRSTESTPWQNSTEALAELEQIALRFEAHEAIPQSRLNVIYELIDHQFSPAQSHKLAQFIEQYDYAKALSELRVMILQLKNRHAN